jgi:hypothetical protein
MLACLSISAIMYAYIIYILDIVVIGYYTFAVTVST